MTNDFKACKYGDLFPSCQDGDPCHYEGANPMKAPNNIKDLPDGETHYDEIAEEVGRLRKEATDALEALQTRVRELEIKLTVHGKPWPDIVDDPAGRN